MTLLIISFIAGVLTVLAPCILPLLPVIIGGSLASGEVNKKRALTVTLSLGVSVMLFTFILKVSSLFINVSPNFWTDLSGGIIIALGLIMLFPTLWDKISFNALINRKSNELLSEGYQKKSFWGDVIIGAALGPIFSTCSPTYFLVLATVLPASPALGVTYLLTYTFGLCLMLWMIAILGQKIMKKLNIAADPKGWLKRGIGILFLLVGIFILTGIDHKLQTEITSSGFFDVTKVEQHLLQLRDEKYNPVVSTPTDSASTNATTSSATPPTSSYLTLAQKAKKYPLAKEIVAPDGFINTNGQPITIASLKGKVVLVDFWTYSCINCQRTIPYLNKWYDKYKDAGLVIVGIHTPEFSFEKVQANVQKGVNDLGIKYPVVLDNEYATWNAYGNEYWPREYLIDMDGFIVHDHIGEGEYDVTEKAIQVALAEREDRLGLATKMPTGISVPADKIDFTGEMVKSPETYFGSTRNEFLENGTIGKDGEQELSLPLSFLSNKLYLGGTWNFTPEYAESSGDASIVFKYNAKNVYMVASSDAGADIEILKDGAVVKTLHVTDNKLYTIIDGTDYGEHTLKINIKSGKLKAFTLTFG